ncbi:sulfite exporter TauE/SafE family protein [Georgenia sp. AZ-5]|uniref:sulfite exporter TauE/SafE family protein n=1 Tax=Georgenia sp. AZ-5 TaxID=3367526 RepID=UPI0037552285
MPGAGTISVAVFAAVLPAKASTGALLVLLLVGDLFAVRSYRAHADWPTLRRLAPAVLLGVLAGTGFLAVAGDHMVRRVIGAVLLALVAVPLAGRRAGRGRQDGGALPGAEPAPRRGRLARLRAGGYGVLAGFTTMVANAGGPVMSLYLLASRFSVAMFLGTAALFFFAINLAKLPFSASLGLITRESLLLDAVLAPAVVVGALVGRPLARRLPRAVFERLVLVLTVVAAANLLL